MRLDFLVLYYRFIMKYDDFSLLRFYISNLHMAFITVVEHLDPETCIVRNSLVLGQEGRGSLSLAIICYDRITSSENTDRSGPRIFRIYTPRVQVKSVHFD
jgi:hypothetical protein